MPSHYFQSALRNKTRAGRARFTCLCRWSSEVWTRRRLAPPQHGTLRGCRTRHSISDELHLPHSPTAKVDVSEAMSERTGPRRTHKQPAKFCNRCPQCTRELRRPWLTWPFQRSRGPGSPCEHYRARTTPWGGCPGLPPQRRSNRGGAAVALTVSTSWMGLLGWRAALQSRSAVPETMVQLGAQCAGAGALWGAT